MGGIGVPPTRCIFSHLNHMEIFKEPDEASALIEVEVRTGVLWMLGSISLCADWISARVRFGIARCGLEEIRSLTSVGFVRI